MPKLALHPFAEEPETVHPVLGVPLHPYAHRILGDLGGLSQFGVHIERLPPGSTSSLRHWHGTEDEFILMLSGEVILHENAGETRLVAGDAAAWPAGMPNGHCLENRSDAPATYLTIGTRNRADVIHYPDHDRICHKDGSARRWTRADGSAVERQVETADHTGAPPQTLAGAPALLHLPAETAT
jgi:uncharacterized cupin superfamily protein